MEIILSKQCKFLTGSLGKGFGYHIQRRTDRDGKTRFWGVRQSKGEIPANGHLRFILTCAELAQMKLHITDIRLLREELREALYEACSDDHCALLSHHCDNLPNILSATDIVNYRRDYLPNPA